MSFTTVKVTREFDCLSAIACDVCGANIPLVFQEANSLQGQNMLHVRLLGSYGEFIDGDEESHLCGECANELQKAWPILFSKGEK